MPVDLVVGKLAGGMTLEQVAEDAVVLDAARALAAEDLHGSLVIVEPSRIRVRRPR